METFALFADQTVSLILYDFLGNLNQKELVELRPIEIQDKKIRLSATRGCLSAYKTLRKLGYIRRWKKYCLSYEFADAEATLYADGESAGLAFALNFAQEMALQKTGESPKGSIAATGVVTNTTEKAGIDKVGEINAKLEAAIECLGMHGRIFYPHDNAEEICSSIESQAAEKGIELIPVSTVAEAIKELLPPLPRAPIWQIFSLLPVILLLAVIGVTDYDNQVYRWVSSSFAHKPSRGDLKVTPKIEWPYVPVSQKSEDKLDIRPSHAAFNIGITPNHVCYLYIYRLDSHNNVWQHFPTEKSVANPLQAGQTYRLPSESLVVYRIGPNPGLETIYIVASRNPHRDLEETFNQFSNAAGQAQEKYRQELKKLLRKAQDPARRNGDIFYFQYLFINEGPKEK